MRLLDAHVHFWDPAARHHDWLADVPTLRRRLGPEDLNAGHHDLAGIVFVQADCRDHEALDEVHWVQTLAPATQLIKGIVAYAPVHLGAGAVETLERLAAEDRVVGVRRLLQGGPAAAIVDPGLIEGVQLLPSFGLTFDVCVTHDQLPQVAELVRASPQTTFILDHLGKPPVASGRLDPWRTDIAAISESPNVVCKLSGLATEAGPRWAEADLRPYLEYALEMFGARRCMVGSDWPVLTSRMPPERWFDAIERVLCELPVEDQIAVAEKSCALTYGIPASVAGIAG